MQQLAAGDASGITEALAAAQRLLDAYGSDVSGGSESFESEAVAPREITACVYQMVAAHGLQQVRGAQRALGPAHPAINHIFHEVVQWKVRGFDQ